MSRHRPWIFPGSNMLVHWDFRPPFRMSQNLELVNFLRLTSPWPAFHWRLHPLASCRRLPKGHKSFPIFRLSCREKRHPFPVHMRKWSSDLKSSLVIFNYHEWLGLDSVTTVCFIYLFIQFPMSRSITLLLKKNTRAAKLTVMLGKFSFF